MASPSTASLKWQKAVLEDGTDVMYEVTVRLYREKLPPQKILNKEFYSKVFNNSQRNILESWEENGTFEISSLARKFDISLHYAVQKYVCQLRNYEDLFNNVKSLVDKRNKVAHPPGAYLPIEGDLNKELGDLLRLYMNILGDLEDYTGDSLIAQKYKIQDSIERKMIKNVDYGNNKAAQVTQPSRSMVLPSYEYPKPVQVEHYSRPKALSTQKDQSSGMSDFSKVAVGVGVAGAIGVGLGALIGALMDGKENKGKK